MPEYDPDRELLIPTVSNDDVTQEAEILRILGKRPHHGLIRRRLQAGSPERLYSPTLEDDAGDPLFAREVPSLSVIESLLAWSASQHPHVQQRVHEFLEDEITLDELISLIQLFNTKIKKPKKLKKPSMSDLIRRAISNGPVTREDLYILSREQGSSKRPEAAVRQIVRRLLMNREIKEDDNGILTER